MAYVVVVDLKLAPEHRADFMPLMLANAAASLAKESGCRQFDICVSVQDPNSVLLYEVYDSAAAFQTHLESPHFLRFNESSAAMVTNKNVRSFLLLDALDAGA